LPSSIQVIEELETARVESVLARARETAQPDSREW
jgi:hypothetical protein